LHLARLYERQQQYAEAEQVYRSALSAAPTDAMAHNDLGLCYIKQRRYDESIECFQKAIELRPHHTQYRNNMADVLVRADRQREAFGHLTSVHSLPEAHYNLGYLLRQNGQMAPARQHLMAALQVDPGFTPAEQLLAEIGDYNQESTFQPTARPSTREVRAPRNLRAQSPSRNSGNEGLIDAEAPSEDQMPSKPRGGYYQGIEEGDEKAVPPAEVLASRAKGKPQRKSTSELRAKIEDSSPNMR
jgi:tetratricopeptide (TPR) repeat protein